MQANIDEDDHHRQRSEFIRSLVQNPFQEPALGGRYDEPVPKTIVQFWHDLDLVPGDIKECISSWKKWEANGVAHHLFDQTAACNFISVALGETYKRAFRRCYHPAMQADYFRLCYLLVEGGAYIDADDVCLMDGVKYLFSDGRLRLQPLCYDKSSAAMVRPSVFLKPDANDSEWIFYFNNNPLIASPGDPVIDYALRQATKLLSAEEENGLPEIQATTGPGNLSKAIFDLGTVAEAGVAEDLVILRDWEERALSRWPLSHRDDARNWRLSNRMRFNNMGL